MSIALKIGCLAAVLAFAVTGCSHVSSTARRTGGVMLGAAAGAGAAYGLGHHDPVKTAIGAVAGAALAHLAEGEDDDVRQSGFDAGYVQGQSDAIKRQYFLRRALEARPVTENSQAGQTVYYSLPGPEVTVDGRKLEPHQVVVRVVE